MIQKERFCTNDREQFDDWLCSEKYELEKALGGNENMANFSYSSKDSSESHNQVADLVNVMLRDTCVKAYREAYNKQG